MIDRAGYAGMQLTVCETQPNQVVSNPLSEGRHLFVEKLMSFDEKIAALIQRLPKLVGHVETEEATKNALVLPFLAALGYDIFNPLEVVPEFTADVGTKKGEKVDYAIRKEDQVLILVECKKFGTELAQNHASQLFRYFSVTQARIAILTNGAQYHVYSDLEEPNKMDSRPFLELDLTDVRPGALKEVKKLAKDEFDLDRMLSAANELKYTSEISKTLEAQLESPSEELVRFFYSQVVPGGRFTAAVKEWFSPLVSKALNQFIRDRVNSRLRTALDSESRPEAIDLELEPEEPVSDDGIVTTEDELEGYRIVRAICCQAVSAERIVHRDTKSYMGILLDDNNRKPICRLHFNTSQKYVGVFDAEKKETRIPISALSDIYMLSAQLTAAVGFYDGDS